MSQNPDFPGRPSVYTAQSVDGAVVRVGKSILRSAFFFNANAASRYLLIYDLTAVPANANGIAPIWILSAATNSKDYLEAHEGILFVNGIVVVNSSTAPALTKGSTDSLVTLSYDP